jgi:hypothetical protein
MCCPRRHRALSIRREGPQLPGTPVDPAWIPGWLGQRHGLCGPGRGRALVGVERLWRHCWLHGWLRRLLLRRRQRNRERDERRPHLAELLLLPLLLVHQQLLMLQLHLVLQLLLSQLLVLLLLLLLLQGPGHGHGSRAGGPQHRGRRGQRRQRRQRGGRPDRGPAAAGRAPPDRAGRAWACMVGEAAAEAGSLGDVCAEETRPRGGRPPESPEPSPALTPPARPPVAPAANAPAAADAAVAAAVRGAPRGLACCCG